MKSRTWVSELIDRFGPNCVYCGAEIARDEEMISAGNGAYVAPPGKVAPTRDHVIPRSRGGSNHSSNIVLSCHSCNVQKRARTPSEWGGIPR